MRKDGRQVARENKARVMRALHRFGWLRTRDLAALCWRQWASKPSGTPGVGPTPTTASAVRMAQRTMRRLRDDRLVITAQGPDGSRLYALSQGGARALKDVGVTAISGKDAVRGFSSAYYRHRCIANQVAISAIVQGFRASTEREIAQGLWLGGEVGIAGKRPDVLLRSVNLVHWVEVELSARARTPRTTKRSWCGWARSYRTASGATAPDCSGRGRRGGASSSSAPRHSRSNCAKTSKPLAGLGSRSMRCHPSNLRYTVSRTHCFPKK